MSLTPGTRLGLYEIVSVLGAGGMGEVYRARDSKLGREVAIKVILDVFAAEPDRVARFEREAKVLASLNHPHIAALYGMDQSGSQHFLIMELVEGQTLADRLLRGALSPAETIGIALQVAEALEAAHERGIVHRDLKPANIKITPDDRVKVLDFGLAKAMENEAMAANISNSPTLSMMASQAGVILGTAAYMSPEQAKGFPADHRSDVFSFGSVMYEMLSGRQPFHGDTAPEVLASVLVREPDITRLPADLDPRLAELVRRCLEKHPKRRWQAIGDVRAELETITSAPRTPAAPVVKAAPPRPLWRRALPAVVSALAVGAIAGAAGWMLRPVPAQPLARFSILLPEGSFFSTPGRSALAVAPDGSSVVYLANNELYVRALGDVEAKPIQGSGGGTISSPVFAPDSKSIAFFSSAERVIKRVPLSGGAPVTLCAALNPFGMSWDDAGIVFAQSNGEFRGIFRVSANGGKPALLASLKPDEMAYGPQVLPGTNTVMFTVTTRGAGADRWDMGDIVAQTPGADARKTLIQGGSDARYLPTGHLVYALRGIVYAVAFDVRRLQITGEAVPVIEGVRRATAATTGLADFSVSRTGLLAYAPGPSSVDGGQVKLAMADTRGTVTPLPLTAGPFQTPRAAPDGSRIAFATDDGKEAIVYVYDLSGTTAMQRITFGGRNRLPVWSADSKRIAFQSDREGDLAIFWQPADGTGTTERLTKPAAGEAHVPLSWHPKDDALLFEVTKGSDTTLWVYTRHDRKSAPFGAVHSVNPTGAVFSPDGDWIAYSSTEQGQTNVFVQPFPATGAKYQVAKADGTGPHHPIWSTDGKRIFFVPRPNGLEAVSVRTTPAFGLGNPEVVPRFFQAAPPQDQRPYDMAPDGRIVATLSRDQANVSPTARQEIMVVLNWFEELKARVGSGR